MLLQDGSLHLFCVQTKLKSRISAKESGLAPRLNQGLENTQRPYASQRLRYQIISRQLGPRGQVPLQDSCRVSKLTGSLRRRISQGVESNLGPQHWTKSRDPGEPAGTGFRASGDPMMDHSTLAIAFFMSVFRGQFTSSNLGLTSGPTRNSYQTSKFVGIPRRQIDQRVGSSQKGIAPNLSEGSE